jgi:lipoate-protein ligase A
MTMRCRVFAYESADGPSNMARDEAMLDAVAADPSCALLRTYGWSEPTLSLGYFQPVALAEAEPRWRGQPLVRRPTGGGAIWHHHELTYALVLPAAHPLARPSSALYHRVHATLARLLQAHGVDVRRRGPDPLPLPLGEGARRAGEGQRATERSGLRQRPFLCFADRDPEDLVFHGIKLVGSAQRRRSGATLQHGSMLLKSSPLTPELAGLRDVSGAEPDPAYWSELVAGALPEALGMVASGEEFPTILHDRARDLEREIYRNLAWNRRR